MNKKKAFYNFESLNEFRDKTAIRVTTKILHVDITFTCAVCDVFKYVDTTHLLVPSVKRFPKLPTRIRYRILTYTRLKVQKRLKRDENARSGTITREKSSQIVEYQPPSPPY